MYSFTYFLTIPTMLSVKPVFFLKRLMVSQASDSTFDASSICF